MKNTHLIIVSLLFVTLNVFAAGNLIHHYTFDGQNGDDSVGTLNPSFQGSVTYSSNAKYGSYALELDGTAPAYIDYPTTDFGNQFSIASWVYLVEYHNIATVISDREFAGGTQDGFQLFLNNHWENRDGAIIFNTANGSVGINNVTPNNTVPSGTWAQVVVTVDRGAGTMDMYLNGAKRTDLNSNACRTDFRNNFAWTIGNCDNHDPGNAYEGLIDDVRIYDGILSDAEVLALYNIPEPATLLIMSSFIFAFLLRRK